MDRVSGRIWQVSGLIGRGSSGAHAPAFTVVFKSLCEQWLDPEKPPKPQRYRSTTYGPTVDGIGSHDAISIITLNRLGLISPGYIDFTSYEPNEERDYKNPEAFNGSDVRAYGNLDIVEVTDFGLAVYKAVIAD